MDPIHPIAPGPPAISRAERVPVQRLERVSRERDRPSQEQWERGRRRPPPKPKPEDGEDDEHPHVDVRA